MVELGALKFYFIVIANSSFGIIIQMFFTYILIGFLLPRYLLKGKYIAFIASLIVLLTASIILFFFLFKNGNPFVAKAVRRTPKIWTTNALISCSVDLVLFNCPTFGGVALGIKLLKRWWLKQKESQQLISAKASAELQLLKAQVHPHFLFNTLNNIYSLTLKASPTASEMVKRLKGLLHYIIHECNQPRVLLEKELLMVQDYMMLEKICYGDQMDMIIDIRGNYTDKMIVPLLLIPFVENSFKHGTSQMLSKPCINLNIIVENNIFYCMLNNSKPEEYKSADINHGIGLTNVQKRLQLLYPRRHKLNITEEPQHFTVLLEVNLEAADEKASKVKKVKGNEMV